MSTDNSCGKKISVIIPTFNEEKLLKRCLRSLIIQKFDNYEVILVDGLSSDKTSRIAEHYGVKVIDSPRRKPHDVGRAKNIGVTHASGKILAFIDADTMLSPNCFSVVNRYFRKSEIVGVACRALPLDGNGIERALYEYNNLLMKVSSRFSFPYLSYYSCIFCRKDAFIRIGGFQEDLNACEDYDLALRLSRHGKIVFSDKISIFMSPRRLREWTYTGYVAKYLKYLFEYHMFGYIYDQYDAIR